MKILHLCLASFYIDNYSYQENLLPKYHKKQGLDVEIIASLQTFDKNGKIDYLETAREYINENGIPVVRLGYKRGKINKIFRNYIGVYEAISKSNPDIIFIHGCQFMGIKHVIKYLKENSKVKVYVDNHADFSNSARNFLSKNILHKFFWKKCAQKINPYATKFYGVLPARVDFLKNVYKIPEEKIELLIMGADDELVEKAKKENTYKEIRKKHAIKHNDLLIVTGGKIDLAKKQILLLMKAVKNIQDKKIKLIVFGPVVNEMKHELDSIVDGEKIQYIGWISPEESYLYFNSADLVVFPGRHSVYWEQAVGLGKPLIVKYWEGTTHVNVNGNCEFLYEDTIDEIQNKLNGYLDKPEKLSFIKEQASKDIKEDFLYSNIAKKSIL